MKRVIVALLAGACGGKTVEPGAASGSSVPARDAGVVAVPVKPVPPSYRIEAPPGGTITRLAVTPSGDAALTLDDASEVRLWPALDGTKPPIAIELPAATALALQRDGANYVAVLGVIGGAVVVRFDGEGKRLAVTELGAIDGVVAIDAGFVTWRGKHLEWLDVAGKVTRTSDTEPRPAAPATTLTAKGSDLVIAGRYLGYAFPYGEPPQGGDVQHMVVKSDHRFLVVTADLTPVGELTPWTPGGKPATAMTWLGDRDWLVDTADGVVLWTERAATGTLVAPNFEVAEVEPTSHLVLLSGQVKDRNATTAPPKQLSRYVPAKHALEQIAFTAWGPAGTTVDLIPPSTNRGALLLLQEFERDSQGIEHGHARWIHDLEHPDQGQTRWNGDLAWPLAVTGSGTLIVNHQAKKWSFVIDGDVKGDLPTDIALSDDATRRLSRTGDGKIELAKLDGTTLWSIPMPGHDARWQSTPVWRHDRIWLVQPHGIAALSPATGAVERAVSGWGFELARAPHPVSAIGRPIAVSLAANRDAPIGLAKDGTFQKLARDVAGQSSMQVLWWGPVKLDGAVHRVAFLQSPNINGSPLFAYLVEVGDAAIAVTCQMWGFPEFQGPFDGYDPMWGTIKLPDGSEQKQTLDLDALPLHSKWIHASYETLTFTLERGVFVAVSDSWLERENTGSNEPGKRYESTSGGQIWPAGRRPKLASYKGHAAKFAVSKPSTAAADLAAGIHELPE